MSDIPDRPREQFPLGTPFPASSETFGETPKNARKRERYGLHISLFLITVATTIIAGGEWAGRMALWTENGWRLLLDPVFLGDGLRYMFPLLFFLTVHEFGHYFAARRHRIDVTLPYYIPFPPGLPILNIGTFGAVIRIRERIRRTRQLFDIGVAGPLAGFVVALGVLIYAVLTLPPITYVMGFGPGHEALQAFVLHHGVFPVHPVGPNDGYGAIAVGDTLLFWFLRTIVTEIPPAWELYHYPVLFAGWLALFFTALNMLPVGQLDGGHVTYALFGPKKHAILARATVFILLFSGALGTVTDIGEVAREAMQAYGRQPWMGDAITWVITLIFLRWIIGRMIESPVNMRLLWMGLVVLVAAAEILGLGATLGWSGWMLWSALIVFIIKVDHPPVLQPEKLTQGRKIVAIVSLIIFVLCFSPKPIYVIM